MTAEPRHHTPRNPARPTRGPAVQKIARAKLTRLMPWQRRAADVALEIDPDTGRYWYSIVVVSVPRQAGKTKLESDVADHRCLTTPRARVWVTMQNGKTVDEWMRDEHFAALAAARAFGAPGTPSCRYKLSKRAGSVGVDWPSIGSTFRTFPPKRDALHSKQSDLVLVDEAWSHDAAAGADLRQAIRPTMNTRPGAQLWVVSTMGDDGSAYLDDYVTMARESLGNPAARVCFIDYGIPDGADAQDLELIAAHHPAYGHTIGMQALIDARDEFKDDPAGFARAYGNRPTRTRSAAIAPAAWAAAGIPRPAVPELVGLGLDATPSGDRFALGAGWRDDTGAALVEPILSDPPTRETPAQVAHLARRRAGGRLTVDRAAIGALELTDAIARDHPDIDITFLSLNEYASACAVFERGIADGTLHHTNDAGLDAAVEVATKRPVADGGFVWGRKPSAGSIADLVACTIGVRAADTAPAPKRKPVARA